MARLSHSFGSTLKNPLCLRALILLAAIGIASPTLAETVNSSDVLEEGTYFASGSMYSRSYRVVAREGDRLCIKIVDGPANPYEGHQNITVSKVFKHDQTDLVVANESELPLIVKGPKTFFVGGSRSGQWQLSERFDRDFSADLKACLESQGNYAKTWQGAFITGLITSDSQGKLTAQDPLSIINVREEPGETATILHHGLVGDRVKLMYSRRDQKQRIWYQVQFESSGAKGWILSDLIQRL